MSKSKQVEVSPKDIAKALDKISAWVRGVRSAVLKMDSKATAKIGKPGGMVAMAAPPGMLDGCPPQPRPKPPIKKKKSK
jgi:hypothetical protein